MDLSSRPSPDEARFMQRQLYRPGQTPPTAKTPASTRTPAMPSLSTAKAPSGAANAKTSRTKHLLAILLLGVIGHYLLYGSPSQRKKILVGLGAAWLFLLGGISYCIFLPDPVAQIKAGFAEMRNLPPEQRREKFREIRGLMRDLTPRQQIELGMERQVRERQKLAEFIKLSPAEQVAKLKKEILDDKARRDQRAARRAANGGNRRGGGSTQRAGRGQSRNAAGATGRGGAGAGGAGRGAGGTGGMAGGRGGGSGGRGGDRNAAQRARLDRSTPGARAMRTYYRGMKQAVSQQMGLPAGGGGRGGSGGRP